MKSKRQAPSRALYDKRAKLLKKSGFALSYRIGRKGSPQQRSAVTRLWNVKRVYLAPRPGTVPAKFVRTTKAQHREVRKFMSREAITPTGFWIQPPKGVKRRDYKVRVGKGELEISHKGRKVRDVVRRLDVEAFLLNPKREVDRVMGGLKPKQFQVMVNGFEGKQGPHRGAYSVKEFLIYVKVFQLDLQEQIDEEKTDVDQLHSVFQLKMIFGGDTPKRKMKKRGKIKKKNRRR